MKKLMAIILSAVMVAALSGCGSKPDEATAAQEQTTRGSTQETLGEDVKAQLDRALLKNEYKGVVQITRDGEVIYQYVNGEDDNGKPLTMDSSLPIASVSKQFCAAAVMKLCDLNKLSVDDMLDKYYPDCEYGKKMTIRDLLTMSSGIPTQLSTELSVLGEDEAENIRLIRESILNEELIFEPGESFAYCNSNYFLLADIVNQVSGVPYHDFLRTEFFEPLGMTHTGFIEEIADAPEWASALSKTELMDETVFAGLANGAGDIVSNAEDMDKWMRGLSSGKVISDDAFRQMTGNPNPNSTIGYSYGLWQMAFDGYGHLGQIEPHFGSVDYMNPDRGVCMFAATNTMKGMSTAEQLPYLLLNILFDNTEDGTK